VISLRIPSFRNGHSKRWHEVFVELRSEQPSRGVTCFDCHSNGHTNKATHLACLLVTPFPQFNQTEDRPPDARPTETRHRVTTPTLRGVFVQGRFGSQRALKTVEDFTEFEQRGAYFDGDDVITAKKGINILERGHQVNSMAEFQESRLHFLAGTLNLPLGFGSSFPGSASSSVVHGPPKL
jgi:hypothetical protein